MDRVGLVSPVIKSEPGSVEGSGDGEPDNVIYTPLPVTKQENIDQHATYCNVGLIKTMGYFVPLVKTDPALSCDEDGGETLCSAANVKMEIILPQLPVEFEARTATEGGSQYISCVKIQKDVAIIPAVKLELKQGRESGRSSNSDIEITVPNVKQECLSSFNRKVDQHTTVKSEPRSSAESGDLEVKHSDIKLMRGSVSTNPAVPSTILQRKPETEITHIAIKIKKRRNCTGMQTLTCSQCTFTCKREKALSKHIMLTHIGMNPYPCIRCPNTFSEKSNLRRHMLVHALDKPFSCSQCSYSSARKYKLKTHMLTHTGEKPFVCLLCSYSCNQKDNLKSHMLTHNGDKPFSCSKCSYTAKRKSNLRMHMVSHADDKLFSCPQCTYTCNQKAYLNIHMNSHTGEKLFTCSQCTYSSIYKGHLMRHSLTHTDAKPFSCSQCSYTCNRKSNLRNHMLTHTGRKPFTCSQCTYSCNWKASLVSHMASHTGEKLFSCSQCTYTCNTKSSLKRHTLTHSNEKPFSCEECEYKCAMRGILKSHVNKQHPR